MVELMTRKMMRGGSLALAGLLGAVAGLTGCTTTPASNGTCTLNAALTCDTVLAGDADAGLSNVAEELKLVGYSCTGTARPDDDAKFVQGVPYGQVCADKGTAADGTFGYCCTKKDNPTTCAYNPIAICPEGYGYQCRGSDRPEAYNPGITCGNGVREDDLINFCCHSQPRPIGCTEARGAATCASGLTGWVCPQGNRPRGEDFGANESRADYYYFVCGVPTLAPNGRDNIYCCFTPSPVLPGGSCVYNPGIMSTISTCTPGHFGFACYGRDTPDQDYLPIHCPDAPVQGTSDEGYAASLYCCDFVSPT
jgi:hypothetical protein